jgi:hypothetical protein
MQQSFLPRGKSQGAGIVAGTEIHEKGPKTTTLAAWRLGPSAELSLHQGRLPHNARGTSVFPVTFDLFALCGVPKNQVSYPAAWYRLRRLAVPRSTPPIIIASVTASTSIASDAASAEEGN